MYRRRCCCPPIVIYDPRIPEIIEWLEDPPFPEPFPEPDPPVPIPFPEPGPDPVPWERLDRLFTAGALDTVKANAGRDLVALKQLAPVEQVAYLNARPYLWCSCGTPTKVADGTIQDDGTFSICWQEPPFLSPSWCHDEFAYVVKQPRFGTLVTIYNGVAANQWFHAGDNPTLSSYSPFAVGCKEPVVPGEGAFVVLQDLGDTALKSTRPVKISTTCTVFAESEVLSWLGKGKKIEDILWGVHMSIAMRSAGLMRRVGIDDEVTFTGGVSRNPAVVAALEQKIEKKLNVSDECHYIGAIGAALFAMDHIRASRAPHATEATS